MHILVPIIALLLTACTGTLAAANPAAGDEQVDETSIESSPGKPRNPLQVELRSSSQLKAGTASDVELIVSNAYRTESIEVMVFPTGSMMISLDHFERRNGELATGKPVAFPLRVTPAGDDTQEILVRVRATMPDGRIMTREVSLPVNGKTQRAGKAAKRRDAVPADYQPADDDAVVSGEQEIIRDNGTE